MPRGKLRVASHKLTQLLCKRLELLTLGLNVHICLDQQLQVLFRLIHRLRRAVGLRNLIRLIRHANVRRDDDPDRHDSQHGHSRQLPARTGRWKIATAHMIKRNATPE